MTINHSNFSSIRMQLKLFYMQQTTFDLYVKFLLNYFRFSVYYTTRRHVCGCGMKLGHLVKIRQSFSFFVMKLRQSKQKTPSRKHQVSKEAFQNRLATCELIFAFASSILNPKTNYMGFKKCSSKTFYYRFDRFSMTHNKTLRRHLFFLKKSWIPSMSPFEKLFFSSDNQRSLAGFRCFWGFFCSDILQAFVFQKIPMDKQIITIKKGFSGPSENFFQNSTLKKISSILVLSFSSPFFMFCSISMLQMTASERIFIVADTAVIHW